MNLHGFESYNKDMQEFMESKLCKEKYNNVLHYLYNQINFEPVKSTRIENEFGIHSTQVRAIIRNARRAGHPIASGGSGYYVQKDFDKYIESLKHLEQRALSQLETIRLSKKNAIYMKSRQLRMAI